jgi:uncharacterized protein YndB with AHSA1/START domain
MSFRNFTTGKSHSFGGGYVELVPNERLRYTDKFDDPNLPGDIQVTVTLSVRGVDRYNFISQASCTRNRMYRSQLRYARGTAQVQLSLLPQ